MLQNIHILLKVFGADILRAEDPKKNLIGFAMDQVFATAQEPIRYGHITSETLIPPSRGLGSSSTAIVGGLLLANALVKHPLSKEELLVIANRMEGHPDNVAPAIYGNLCCATGLKIGTKHGHFYSSGATFCCCSTRSHGIY